MTESQTPGYWTFHAFAPIDDVATALLLADISYDALSQAATLRPGASEGREEAPHEEDFDTESTVVYAQAWTDSNRPDMPVPGEWVFEPERDWNVEWRKGIEPVRIGEVLIVPPWLDEVTPSREGDIRLIIDPGQAFGTGHHETTSNCITALLQTDLAGKRVADIGTGTGILAIIAAARGAREVIAVDNDPLAIEVAKPLVDDHRDRLFPGVPVFIGEGSTDTVPKTPPFDVVIANMISPILMELADDLAALLAPDGILIMSGISNPRAVEVQTAFTEAGITLTLSPGQEWALATGHHTDTA